MNPEKKSGGMDCASGGSGGVIVPRGVKPLGHRAYGSIPHLPGSRRGPGDKGLSVEQAAILTDKVRDKKDVVIVQEKLDGSNVAVAKLNGEIVPLIRAGYLARESRYEQHHVFHEWAMENRARFDGLLQNGERCCGEWLMQAHGTRYDLPHEPFVVFDVMRGHRRAPWLWVETMAEVYEFTAPRLIHCGQANSIASVLERLEPSGHGALDPVEGAVWRLERDEEVEFLGKFVRPEKVDGCYLPDVSGKPPVYNWKPRK